jgi:hypothetical protein
LHHCCHRNGHRKQVTANALNRHRQLIHGWRMESSVKTDSWMTHGIVNENLNTPDLEIIIENFVKADALNRQWKLIHSWRMESSVKTKFLLNEK